MLASVSLSLPFFAPVAAPLCVLMCLLRWSLRMKRLPTGEALLARGVRRCCQ